MGARRLATGLAAVALVAAGCGGEGGEGGEGGSSADSVAGTGYTVETPAGWRDGKEEAEESGQPIRFDLVIRREPKDGFATNVNVIRTRVDVTDLDRIAAQQKSELEDVGGRDFGAPARTDVDGETAVGRVYTFGKASRPLRGRQYIAPHEGSLYAITFTTLAGRFEREQGQFDEVLRSWKWK